LKLRQSKFLNRSFDGVTKATPYQAQTSRVCHRSALADNGESQTAQASY
jgi:hypothetical protein